MSDGEDPTDTPDDDSVDSDNSREPNTSGSTTSTTRRGFLWGGAAAATGGAGYVFFTNRNDFGEFEIGIERPIPLVKDLPFVEYYSEPLVQRAITIEEIAEEDINGRTVAGEPDTILTDLNYYTDDEVFSIIDENPGFVGDPEAITRLLNWQHYSTIKMGIEAGGYMEDIQQYLEKDLQRQYANNAADPFHEALQITNDVANERFDINPATDERDDQFVGMELYMLGNWGSMAGRYFNTSEIEEYAESPVSVLREDLEQEAISEGGFSFYL